VEVWIGADFPSDVVGIVTIIDTAATARPMQRA
jgi:hypothetical protein